MCKHRAEYLALIAADFDLDAFEPEVIRRIEAAGLVFLFGAVSDSSGVMS